MEHVNLQDRTPNVKDITRTKAAPNVTINSSTIWIIRIFVLLIKITVKYTAFKMVTVLNVITV